MFIADDVMTAGAMESSRKIAVVVGSLRRDSLNRKTARALQTLAPPTLTLEIVEIGDLALYNEDVESQGAPAPWTAFRQHIKAADGLIFVTPEYNRSVPGAMKNAIDVGSRPIGQSAWSGKPAGIVTVSPGAYGGFGANHHLRQSLVFLNVFPLQQPEAYIGTAGALFDAQGNLTSDKTRELLSKFVQAFAAWVELHAVKA
jgi:chromate reductase, NAD(P)H dehydrogenase (quinone)